VYDSRRGSVRAWLTTITHNLAIDVVRARAAVPVDPDDLPVMMTALADGPGGARGAALGGVEQGPEWLVVARDSAAQLRRALGRLPSTQARAVAMAGIYGMTAQQVADAEGIPLGTAKTRIRDGMQKLRAAYLPEDVGDE
jgi:RNA polymerase sigma-70 factor (ECF subfamily)